MEKDNNYQTANKSYFRAQKIDKLLGAILFIYLVVMFYSLIYAFWLFKLLFIGFLLYITIVVVYEIIEWLLS